MVTAFVSILGTIKVAPLMVSSQTNTDRVIPYITTAIPFFLLQMGVEKFCIWAANIGEHSPAAKYDLADSWSSANAGWMQQLAIKIILEPLVHGGAFIFVYETFKVHN